MHQVERGTGHLTGVPSGPGWCWWRWRAAGAAVASALEALVAPGVGEGLQRVRSRMGAPPRRRRLWRIKVSSTEGADPEPHAAGQAPRVASGLAREMRGHLASHKEGPSQNLSSNQSPRLALQESLTGAAPVTQRRWPSSDPVTATAPPVRGAPGAQQGVGLEAAPSFGPTLWS